MQPQSVRRLRAAPVQTLQAVHIPEALLKVQTVVSLTGLSESTIRRRIGERRHALHTLGRRQHFKLAARPRRGGAMTAAPLCWHDAKRLATLTARAALAGVTVTHLEGDLKPHVYIVSRWSLTREFTSLNDLEAWIDLVSGRPATA
jgi:hypothetical protein